MNRKKRSIVSILLSIVMVVGLLPVNPIVAQAQTSLSYRYPVYNVTSGTVKDQAVSGIKEWKTAEITSYTVVENSDKAVEWETSGWYVVQGTVTITGSVTISGNPLAEVNLLLTDGSSLTVSEIDIGSAHSNRLCIYGQENGTGKLTVTGVNSDGISVGGSASIVINGGDISVTGGEYGAGIGGSGYMTVINGGKVTANGGKKGAGIGGGNTGNASNIIINGGTVAATGGAEGGAGIGGGVGGAGSDIIINGGTVTKADGGTAGGAGIGGGYHGDGSNITINGGTVTATGGFYYDNAMGKYTYAGAGIGGGSGRKASGVTIKGGTVTANAKVDAGATAIGSGRAGEASENISIDLSRQVIADGNEVVIEYNNPEKPIAGQINGKNKLEISIKKCGVTYDSNGATEGTVPTDATVYDYATEVTVKGNTGNLKKTDCVFGGWNTKNDGTGTTYAENDKYSITEKAAVLYAKWVPDHEKDDWTYTKDGATLTATCKKDGCAKAPHSISITLNAPDMEYNQATYEATITNADAWKTAGLAVPQIEYKNQYGWTIDPPKTPGQYSAVINHENVEVSVTFNISPIELTVTGTKEPTMVYNGKDNPKTYINTDCGSLSGVLEGDSVTITGIEFTYSSRDVGDKKDVKAHYILGGTNEGCYTLKDVDMKGSITPAPIKIVAENKESWEGDSLEELTFVSYYRPPLVPSWVKGGLFEGDQFTGKLATNADKDTVGNQYTITQGTLTAGSNYTITYVGATYTVKEGQSQTLTFAKSQVTKTYGDEKFTETATPGAAAAVTYASNATNVAEVNSATGEVTIKGAGTATITAATETGGGYKAASATYTLTVNKRDITLTSATEQKDFDATPLKNETITVSGDGYAYGETFAYSGFASQTDVGETDNTFTYSDKDGALTANYNVTAVYGKLKVVAASGLTLTNAGYTGKYDGEAHGYEAKCNIADAVVTYSTDGGGSWSSVIPEIKDVGSLTVKAKAERANFNSVTADFTLKVNKREVTLTSGSATQYYNGAPLTNDEVTVSGDGFVSGEGAAFNVTGSQTEIGSSKNTFTYTLNQGTKEGNYKITKAEGNLVVAEEFFDVSFDMDNKGVQVETQKVASGSCAIRPATDPEEEGWDFLGWFKEGLTEVFDFTTKIFANTTIYAKWKLKPVTVSFDYETEATKTRKVEPGTAITLPKVTKEGFTFAGWLVESEMDPGEYVIAESPFTVQEDTMFHALFVQVKTVNGKPVPVAETSSEIRDFVSPYEDKTAEEAHKSIVENKSAVKAPVGLSDAIKGDELLKIYGGVEGATSLVFGMDSSLKAMQGFEQGSTAEKKISFSVSPWVQVATATDNHFYTVENDQLNGSRITFRLAIPASVTEKYAKSEHWSEDGKLIETLYLPIQEVTVDGKKEKYVEASASQFSDFILTFTNEKPADPEPVKPEPVDPEPVDPDPVDPKPVTPTYDDSSDTYVAKPVKTGTWGDPVTDGTWAQNADGTWTYKTNAAFKSTWGYIRNPYAKAGQPADGWYYFDANGKMLVGWQFIGGKWYYLNPTSDGTLGMCFLDTTTPDGYKVDKNGAWIQ